MSSASTRLLLRDSRRAPPNWIGARCNKLAYQLCPPSFTTRGIAERSLADSLRAVNYNFLPMSPQSATSRSQQSQGPSVTPPSRDGKRPRLISEANRFWQRVTEGMELGELMSQFKQDAQTGFRFYRKDYAAGAEPAQRPGFLHRVQELMWAILGKLTPARRVLLLAGIVLLLLPGGGAHFQSGDRDVTFSGPSFQFWGGAVLFVLLMLEIADRVIMKRDLEIARDIQSWLLPATPPAVDGLEIAFATRPANTVAGDFYDVFARQNSSATSPAFLMAVADVAGKSIPAALLMATFQASLKTLSATPCSLPDLAKALNQYACGNSQGGLRFTTAFLAEYDPATRVLNYANAGHNNPMFRRSSGAIERLVAGGLPLGIQAEARYESGSVTLRSGDWLVIFTDGLVEAENQFAQEYGEERLLNVLHGNAAATPEALLQRMIAEVNAFVGPTPQHDDITCMLIKVA
jgi:phosphoserine phosphatase RsbU/P